jgi:hypothetical protein
MAIVAGMTEMIMAGRPDVTFARLCTDQPFPTVRETLVLDGGEYVLRQHARDNARDYKNQFSHDAAFV